MAIASRSCRSSRGRTPARDGRPDPPPAVRAALTRALARGSKHAQMEADGVLGYLAPRPDDAIGPLVSALDDPDAFTRTVAARALGDAHASAPAARAALARALADRDPDVRAAAVAVETLAAGGGFIVAPSDSILDTGQTARRNFDLMIEGWKELRS